MSQELRPLRNDAALAIAILFIGCLLVVVGGPWPRIKAVPIDALTFDQALRPRREPRGSGGRVLVVTILCSRPHGECLETNRTKYCRASRLQSHPCFHDSHRSSRSERESS